MKTVACPRCGQPAAVGEQNRWRPFCSERCRLIDLGLWASEEYRVPTEDQQPPDDLTSKPPGS